MQNKNFLNRYMSLLELIRATDSQNDPIIKNCLKVIRAFSHKPEIVERQMAVIQKRLEPRIIRRQMNTNPFNNLPTSEVISGQIRIGTIIGRQNLNFGLSLEQLNQNLLIVGRAGAGKTTLVLNIVRQLIEADISCWMIDFKQDYRRLLHFYPDMVVIRWQDFKFNPLKPPEDVDPLNWLQIFFDVFTQALDVRLGSKFILIDYIDQLYKEYDVYDGGKYFPTMLDLHTLLKERVRDKQTSVSDRSKIFTCLNKTTALIKRLGNVFDCSSGFPLEELLNRNVVFELNGLSVELQAWLVNMLLCWVFNYRIASGKRGKLRNMIIFDEAKLVFGKEL